MQTYIEQLKRYIIQNMVENAGESVCDILYNCYHENNAVDEDAIRQAFDDLDTVLSRLTLKEYDRVWDAACRLCDKHERRGFLAGLRIGSALMLELAENEQGEDSCF